MTLTTLYTVALAYVVGFATPHVWNFLTWQRGKYRRKVDEWQQ